MEELISRLRNNTAKAQPFGAIIKFDTGPNGVLCIDGTGETIVVDDIDRDAKTTIILSQDALEKLMRGKLNPAMAAMSGKLKVKGDMSLALKLANFL